MTDTVETEPVPIATGADGVMRLRGTRIMLDTIVAAFKEGATAEEIAKQTPSVSLGDVYQTIGYYLHHAHELDSYLADRQKQSDETRRTTESRWSQKRPLAKRTR